MRVPNPSGLLALGENLYAETPASGAPVEGMPEDEGYGKLTKLGDGKINEDSSGYKRQHRGGSGVKTLKVTEKSFGQGRKVPIVKAAPSA